MCGAVCVRACVRGPERIGLSAWLVLSGASSLPRAPRRVTVVGGGVGEVMSSRGRRGGRGWGWENYQLAERSDNAGEGQVGVWLKRRAFGDTLRGRGPLFVGIDLCGEGLGPTATPQARTVDQARRDAVWGRRNARETRGRQPAARGHARCPVPLNSTKKGYACS